MAENERYTTTWHGLIPRFVLASLVFAFVGVLLQRIIYALIPTGVNVSEVYDIVSVAYFPFAVFALFYLSSSVRIDLGKDFAPVAASIFLGTLAVLLLFEVPEALQANPGTGVIDIILQLTASAVYESISYAFVGFAAILLSYRRRM